MNEFLYIYFILRRKSVVFRLFHTSVHKNNWPTCMTWIISNPSNLKFISFLGHPEANPKPIITFSQVELWHRFQSISQKLFHVFFSSHQEPNVDGDETQFPPERHRRRLHFLQSIFFTLFEHRDCRMTRRNIFRFATRFFFTQLQYACCAIAVARQMQKRYLWKL